MAPGLRALTLVSSVNLIFGRDGRSNTAHVGTEGRGRFFVPPQKEGSF